MGQGLFYNKDLVETKTGMNEICRMCSPVLTAIMRQDLVDFGRQEMSAALHQFFDHFGLDLLPANCKQEVVIKGKAEIQMIQMEVNNACRQNAWMIRQAMIHVRTSEYRSKDFSRITVPMKGLCKAYRSWRVLKEGKGQTKKSAAGPDSQVSLEAAGSDSQSNPSTASVAAVASVVSMAASSMPTQTSSVLSLSREELFKKLGLRTGPKTSDACIVLTQSDADMSQSSQPEEVEEVESVQNPAQEPQAETASTFDNQKSQKKAEVGYKQYMDWAEGCPVRLHCDGRLEKSKMEQDLDGIWMIGRFDDQTTMQSEISVMSFKLPVMTKRIVMKRPAKQEPEVDFVEQQDEEKQDAEQEEDTEEEAKEYDALVHAADVAVQQDKPENIKMFLMNYHTKHSVAFREIAHHGKQGRQVGALTNKKMPLQSVRATAETVLRKLNAGCDVQEALQEGKAMLADEAQMWE